MSTGEEERTNREESWMAQYMVNCIVPCQSASPIGTSSDISILAVPRVSERISVPKNLISALTAQALIIIHHRRRQYYTIQIAYHSQEVARVTADASRSSLADLVGNQLERDRRIRWPCRNQGTPCMQDDDPKARPTVPFTKHGSICVST